MGIKGGYFPEIYQLCLYYIFSVRFFFSVRDKWLDFPMFFWTPGLGLYEASLIFSPLNFLVSGFAIFLNIDPATNLPIRDTVYTNQEWKYCRQTCNLFEKWKLKRLKKKNSEFISLLLHDKQ